MIFMFNLNPTKPRSKSFEITLINGGKGTFVFILFVLIHYTLWVEVLLWSGLKKGPPRKLKFPDSEIIIEALQEHLN